MATNEQVILESALSFTTEDINKIVQEQKAGKLQSAAREFLNNINSQVAVYKRSAQHELKLLKGSGKGSMSLSQFYIKMRRNNTTIKNCIKQMYIFQAALNEFLNREIILLFVDQFGKMLYGDESIIHKFVSKTSQARGRADISFNSKMRRQLQEYPSQIAKDFEATYQQLVLMHKPIYEQTKTRLQINKNGGSSQKIRAFLEQHKLKSTFWWEKNKEAPELNDRYGWSRTTSLGQLAEGYASLVWQNGHTRQFNPNVEEDIADFYHYMQNAGIYDNISGVVKGDVQFFKNEFLPTAIEFAVKSTDASTGSIGGYLIVALLLTSTNFIITEDSVRYVLDNLQSYTNIITRNGLEKCTERINNDLKMQGIIVT